MKARRAVRVAPAIVAVLALSACGGRDPWPVPWNQPGDEASTCSKLIEEVTQNETEIIRRLPAQDQSGRNAVLYGAGVFLILPWFAMDLRLADSIEIRAYFERNAWLRELGARKRCDMPAARVKIGQTSSNVAPVIPDD